MTNPAQRLEETRQASINARRGLANRVEDLEIRLKNRMRPRAIPDPAFSIETVRDRLSEAIAALAVHDAEHQRKFGNAVQPKADPRDAEIARLHDQNAALAGELRKTQDKLSAALNR